MSQKQLAIIGGIGTGPVVIGLPMTDVRAALVEPGLNGLEQSYVRGSGRYDKDVQAYSATLKARLGPVDITSISGHGACAEFFRKAHELARPG